MSSLKDKNVHQRINMLVQKVSGVARDDVKLPKGGYKAFFHNAVTAAVRKHLPECGLNIYCVEKQIEVVENQCRMWGEALVVNVDNPQEVVSWPWYAHGNDNQDKGPGKAVSLGFKTALLKNLFIEDADEDPENSHVPTRKPAQRTQPKQQPDRYIAPSFEEGFEPASAGGFPPFDDYEKLAGTPLALASLEDLKEFGAFLQKQDKKFSDAYPQYADAFVKRYHEVTG